MEEKFSILRTLQTEKVFPANFISAILSAIICTKSYFHSCQKQTMKASLRIHYDKIQDITILFSSITYSTYGINTTKHYVYMYTWQIKITSLQRNGSKHMVLCKTAT